MADQVIFIKQGHCLYNSTHIDAAITSHAVEFETTASRETITALFTGNNIELRYNGGFYTITSPSLAAQDIIGILVASKTPVTYFRDITYSTKRFF